MAAKWWQRCKDYNEVTPLSIHIVNAAVTYYNRCYTIVIMIVLTLLNNLLTLFNGKNLQSVISMLYVCIVKLKSYNYEKVND